MATYLVIHTPAPDKEMALRAPTRLRELAEASLTERVSPRWLKTWSPDLNDDRIVSLWEADNAAEIAAVLERFGFLNDMEAQPLRVREWGPSEVLAAEGEPES
ncbi:MAG: hypothetical protein IT337_11790 [Thermomicrobiales bacterium]|nr:hypothetical protein [Thermomicrobiales bacterium]